MIILKKKISPNSILQVQVVNNNPKDTDIFFKVYCPGQYDKTPHKEIMYQDGSVSNNIRYLDICVEKFIINVAFNQEPGWFELNWHGLVNTMVKYGMSHGKFVGTERFISQNHEILSIFFQNYNIIQGE